MSEEGLNRVQLIGRLVADGELRYTQSSQPVLNFRVATSESYFDKNSNARKENTEFHSIVLWGKRGEALSKILSKGSRICVEGKLQTRSWQKGEETRYSTEINAQNVILLGGKSRGERQDDAANGGGGDDHQHDAGGEMAEGDIPFASSHVSSKETIIGEAWSRANGRLI